MAQEKVLPPLLMLRCWVRKMAAPLLQEQRGWPGALSQEAEPAQAQAACFTATLTLGALTFQQQQQQLPVGGSLLQQQQP